MRLTTESFVSARTWLNAQIIWNPSSNAPWLRTECSQMFDNPPKFSTIVFSAGGLSLAGSDCVWATYDVPHIPTSPLPYGSFETQSIVSKPSYASDSKYFTKVPCELYRPRESCTTTT